MRELERALADITAIRSQMARGAEFRGYGPMTIAATGLLAGVAAVIQVFWLPDPKADLFDYLVLWVSTAALSAGLIGVEMVARSRRIHAGLADEMIHAATEQFIPTGITGALLPFVLFRFAPQCLWMLPGLWQIIFGLGVLASCRCLPRPLLAAGVWYLASGLANIALSSGTYAFSPWAMALPFGVGQFCIATLLYFGVKDHAT